MDSVKQKKRKKKFDEQFVCWSQFEFIETSKNCSVNSCEKKFPATAWDDVDVALLFLLSVYLFDAVQWFSIFSLATDNYLCRRCYWTYTNEIFLFVSHETNEKENIFVLHHDTREFQINRNVWKHCGKWSEQQQSNKT